MAITSSSGSAGYSGPAQTLILDLEELFSGGGENSNGGDGVYTVTEISEITGQPAQRVRARIRELVAEGRCTPTRKAIEDLAGRKTKIYAYKFVGESNV